MIIISNFLKKKYSLDKLNF